MKNKHLVLLFLLTLLVGLAVRRAPWRNATFFQANLLRLDTAEVQQVQIVLPGKPVLILLRGDAGWSAEQSERSVNVPSGITQEILAALADLRSIRIAKTNREDTLGFIPNTEIQLTVLVSDTRRETISIGWETIENGEAATFVQLPKHEGIYLANNHLRKVFTKKLADFRNRAIAQFQPSSVQNFAVTGQSLDSLSFSKNDSTGMWEDPSLTQSLPNDRVQTWLYQIIALNGLAFADLFDESHATETSFAQIRLDLKGQQEPLYLKIFRLNQVNIPEEMPAQKPDRGQFAPYVLHSSQNPTNYFVCSDTLRLQQICQPF